VNDYGRFVRMLLNGGELEGARVLKAETVTLMSQNNIGAVSVPALKTALPRSADFSFIADGRDKWGLGFLITTDQVPGKRSPGSLSWGGINNTYFWIDPSRGIAGVILMQYLPFADVKALAVYDAFERGAYEPVSAGALGARLHTARFRRVQEFEGLSLCVSLALARIRSAGQRLPYHQNAQTRRTRGHASNAARIRLCVKTVVAGVAQSPGTNGGIRKAEKPKRKTRQILSSWRREWETHPGNREGHKTPWLLTL
jgi:CubicO group peptidase (beta-lactamase class C family)